MANQRISESARIKTTIELPSPLKDAADVVTGQLRELGERSFMTDLLQAGLFNLLQGRPEEIAVAIKTYRRAMTSDLPLSSGKVITFRRPGRPRKSA